MKKSYSLSGSWYVKRLGGDERVDYTGPGIESWRQLSDLRCNLYSPGRGS